MSSNARPNSYNTMKRKLRQIRRISMDNFARSAIASVLVENVFASNPAIALSGSLSSLNEVDDKEKELECDGDKSSEHSDSEHDCVEDEWLQEVLDSLWIDDDEETPKTRSRNSFRILSSKTKDKRVQVKAHLSNEDLEKKKNEVERTIQFHKDAVQKNIPEFLSDTATILLENIISLTTDLNEILTAFKSQSDVKALSTNLHKCIAELMWWSNQFHLYGDEFKSKKTLDEITKELTEALGILVELAIHKDEYTSPMQPDETPQNSRLIINGTKNHNGHHGSLPEIPTLTLNDTSDDSFNQTHQLSPNSKLIHSLSSDSILDYKEGTNEPQSPNNVYNSNNSLECAPPIPPKKLKHKGTCGYESPLGQSSPIQDYPLRHSTGSSTPSMSFERMSPVSNSMNHSIEERTSFHSFDSTEWVHPPQSPELTYLDNQSLHDATLSQIRHHPLFGSSSSPSYNSSSNKFTQIFESSQHSKVVSHLETSSQVTSHSKQILYHNSRLSKCSSSASSRSSDIEGESNRVTMTVPPELPKKLRPHGSMSPDRITSQYENITCSVTEDSDCKFASSPEVRKYPGLFTSSRSSSSTCSESGIGSSVATLESCNAVADNESTVVQRRFHETFVSTSHNGDEKPPLPLKKRHIMEYLEIVKDYQRLPEKDQRRSQQTFIGYQGHSLESDMNICSRLSLPPALPPKMKPRNRDLDLSNHNRVSDECMCTMTEPSNTVPDRTDKMAVIETENHISGIAYVKSPPVSPHPVVPERTVDTNEEVDHTVLDLTDVSEYLVMNNKNDPYVAAGHPEALLVHAAQSKSGHFVDAFLLTYRTFMKPEILLDKLSYRYKKYYPCTEPENIKASRSSFALLVKAVHDFIDVDLKDSLLEKLSMFEFDLLADGELKYALLLRREIASKLNLKRSSKVPILYPSGPAVHHTFLDFKAPDIAEQITLLEAESFNRVGIPEALHWSRDQDEEHCPNLRAFTMHFNSISFWVKTLILKCNSNDREKYFKKFVKIIKHLRKINNFNTCLAILSAIESSAIERLGLHHSVQEELKEYHTLFDHFSFKVYRKELAEAKPPCIPYLGIILKDLTLAHYGNSDTVDGYVNFEKRWIQYKILKDIKKFTPSKFKFKKNEAILKFLDDFKHSLTEDDVWALSYKIKPKNE